MSEQFRVYRLFHELTLYAANSVPAAFRPSFCNEIGYSNEESFKKRVYENFDVKTTKSIMLRKIYETALENSNKKLQEGDLVLFENIELQQRNIDDTIMILNVLQDSKFKNQGNEDLEINLNNMLEIGTIQNLTVVKKVDFGVYLAEPGAEDKRVLLPARQVPPQTSVGDQIEVFLYKDSSDRLISTTARPKLLLGEVVELTVAQTAKMGAFLEWGLEKDLFLPFKEQTRKVKEGDRFPVALYVDKSGRLCATMKVYHYLRTDSPYHKDDRVSGCLYEISRQFGAFVAVDNRYSALIPPKEMYGELKIGDHVEARVVRVHEDGKLDLSVREKAYLQIETDAEKVMKLIDSFDGVLPFTDKASPEVIRRELAMSKNEFKRAVGNLLKNGRIEITEKAIRRI